MAQARGSRAGARKAKERNARLYVFAGKPAVAGAARGDVARAGTLRRAGIQFVSDRRHGARSHHRSFAARSGLHGRRESVEDRARARKGRGKDSGGRQSWPHQLEKGTRSAHFGDDLCARCRTSDRWKRRRELSAAARGHDSRLAPFVTRSVLGSGSGCEEVEPDEIGKRLCNAVLFGDFRDRVA